MVDLPVGRATVYVLYSVIEPGPRQLKLVSSGSAIEWLQVFLRNYPALFAQNYQNKQKLVKLKEQVRSGQVYYSAEV